MLGGLEVVVIAQAAWLANTKQKMGLKRARIVARMWPTAALHVSRVRARALLLGIALFVGPGSIPALQ